MVAKIFTDNAIKDGGCILMALVLQQFFLILKKKVFKSLIRLGQKLPLGLRIKGLNEISFRLPFNGAVSRTH